MVENNKLNKICILRKKIEGLIDNYFPFNELIEIPGDLFWCKYFIDNWGVYVLFANKNIIYIGMSSNLGLRLNSHFHSIDYGNEISKVGIIRTNYSDWYDIAAIEAYLINKFSPLYNKSNKLLNCKPIPDNFDINKVISQIQIRLK